MKRKKVSSLSQRLKLILDGRLNYRVPELPDSNKLTIDQLIKLTNCGTRQSIHRWINGTIEVPNLDSLDLIAKKFNVSIDWLLGYDVLIIADKQYDYEVFKEYGFSYDFFNTILLFKENIPTIYNNYVNTLDILFRFTKEFDQDIPGEDDRSITIPILDSLSALLLREVTLKSYVVEAKYINTIYNNSDTLDLDSIEQFRQQITRVVEESKPINYDNLDEVYFNDIKNDLKNLRDKLDSALIDTDYQ